MIRLSPLEKKLYRGTAQRRTPKRDRRLRLAGAQERAPIQIKNVNENRFFAACTTLAKIWDQ